MCVDLIKQALDSSPRNVIALLSRDQVLYGMSAQTTPLLILTS